MEELKKANPNEYHHHPKTKILKRITDLILHKIPADPNHPSYLLDNPLGVESRHWRRAKFLQRYRLFFRFDSRAKEIIYVWINDEKTLRCEGSKSDPYEIFKKLLNFGSLPNNWEELYQAVKTE